MEYMSFTWIDYLLFTVMIGLSGIVGIYFGCYKKQNTTKDYLHGGRQMKVFPVAMSLVASTLSGVALLGLPTEVYMNGTQYSLMTVSVLFVGVFIKIFILPVYYKLQIISIYEYLEIRFDKTNKIVASAINTVMNLIMLPIYIYAPSMAFNYVTGISIHLIALLMSCICIFYTTIGGVRAVVWADTIQFSVTLCTLAVVLVIGLVTVGGPKNMWEKGNLGQRIEFFNMDPDPTTRTTFWSALLGSFSIWACYIGANQGTIQRFLAVPTYSDAVIVLIIFIFFTMLTKAISFFTGLIIYAKYFDCDPLTAKHISKPDQILPFYVLDVAGNIPGISGLFLAGLFSTALSTLSTILNSLAGTIYRDFILPFVPENISQKKTSTIMKTLTFALGVVSFCLIFVVERLGTVVEMLNSFTGIGGGPMLGVFMLGMMFPSANKKGALWGILMSIALMSLIVIGNQYLVFIGKITFIPKPLRCNATTFENELFQLTKSYSNDTIQPSTSNSVVQPFWLFRISFFYYHLIGATFTIIIGLIVSWFTKDVVDLPINPDLFSPCVHRFISKSSLPNKSTAQILEMQLTTD